MESPFPAPGKTIKVKTFLPGAGNEVGNCCCFHLWPWTGSKEEPGQPELQSLGGVEHRQSLPSYLVHTPNRE